MIFTVLFRKDMDSEFCDAIEVEEINAYEATQKVREVHPEYKDYYSYTLKNYEWEDTKRKMI